MKARRGISRSVWGRILWSTLVAVSLLSAMSGCKLLDDLFNPKTGKFQPGDVVTVVGTYNAGLRVREAPAGNVITTVPDGWVFRVLSGPESAVLDGKIYIWWRLREERYEPSPVTGWAAEDFLEEVPQAGLVPGSPPQYFVSAQDSVEEKVQWAESMVGNRTWYNPETGMTYCLGFVAQAFTGQQSTDWVCPGDESHSCPNGGKQKLLSEGKFYQAGECWNPPRGALVFFSSAPIDDVYYGHIGICLGDGKMVHVPAEGAVRINTIAEVVAERYIYSYDGWAYPPSEWITTDATLVGESLFCVEQGGFDYCSRIDWGYSKQWLQNGATNEILLADARRMTGTLEPIGSADFDRIEVRLRTWACYPDAWAKLTTDNIVLIVRSTGQLITLDDMEGAVLERWEKREHPASGRSRGGNMLAVVSPADRSQALQVYVPTGIDAHCAGVWAVRAFDLPSTLDTSDVILKLFPFGEGQGYYHEGFIEIFLYKRP